MKANGWMKFRIGCQTLLIARTSHDQENQLTTIVISLPKAHNLPLAPLIDETTTTTRCAINRLEYAATCYNRIWSLISRTVDYLEIWKDLVTTIRCSRPRNVLHDASGYRHRSSCCCDEGKCNEFALPATPCWAADEKQCRWDRQLVWVGPVYPWWDGVPHIAHVVIVLIHQEHAVPGPILEIYTAQKKPNNNNSNRHETIDIISKSYKFSSLFVVHDHIQTKGDLPQFMKYCHAKAVKRTTWISFYSIVRPAAVMLLEQLTESVADVERRVLVNPLRVKHRWGRYAPTGLITHYVRRSQGADGYVTSSIKAAATDIRVGIDNRALAIAWESRSVYFFELAAKE